MRLVRRTLLCLIVGVTAFGVAGWGLRPRATWEGFVEAGLQDDCDLVNSDRPCGPDEPVWVAAWDSTTFSPATKRNGRLIAYDPATGAVRHRFATTAAEAEGAQLTGDGHALVRSHVNDATRIRLFDGRTGRTAFDRRLPGDWSLNGARTHAWRHVHRDAGDGFTLHVVELATGRTTMTTMDTPDCYVAGEAGKAALSPDAARFAVCEGTRGGFTPSRAFQLWDVRAGKMIARPTPPDARGEDAGHATSPRFVEVGKFLIVSTEGAMNSEWVYDAATGALSNGGELTPPPLQAGQQTYLLADVHGPPRLCLWWDTPGLWPDGAFVSVTKDGRTVAPWRRVPFQNWQSVPIGRFVEGSPQFVLAGEEPSMQMLAPTAVKPLIPMALREEDQVSRLRWHDWQSGDWRDVGCRLRPRAFQVRRGKVIVLGYGDGRRPPLQAWSLPPRDPAPIAFAFATICMVATWWICEWRYRRRTRLASVGAA